MWACKATNRNTSPSSALNCSQHADLAAHAVSVADFTLVCRPSEATQRNRTDPPSSSHLPKCDLNDKGGGRALELPSERCTVQILTPFNALDPSQSDSRD